MALVAALLLAGPVLFNAGSTAHAAEKEISGLTLSSPNPGELVIAWNAASPAPDDYRVMWAKSGERFKKWNDPSGNAFPGTNSHTVNGLEEGAEYKVKVRSRYTDSKNGAWSEGARLVVAAALEPELDGLPSPPTGTAALATWNQVVLLWDAPPDADGVTGYRILRGANADSLETLVEDTGNTRTEYTDIGITAGTVYAYAVVAINPVGASERSEAALATIPPVPPERAGQGELGTTLIGTLKQPSNGAIYRSAYVRPTPRTMYQKFTTGSNPDGYKVDGVMARLLDVAESSVPRIKIVEWAICPVIRSTGTELTNPGNFAELVLERSRFTAFFAAPPDTVLKPNTTYWVTFAETSPDGFFHPAVVDSMDSDSDSEADWTMTMACGKEGTGSLRGLEIFSSSNSRAVSVIGKPVE